MKNRKLKILFKKGKYFIYYENIYMKQVLIKQNSLQDLVNLCYEIGFNTHKTEIEFKAKKILEHFGI